MVLVVVFPILVVAFVIAVACITIVAVIVVVVVVLFAFSIARRPLFVVLGTVLLLAVRTIAIFFFVAVFATFLTSRTVLLV